MDHEPLNEPELAPELLASLRTYSPRPVLEDRVVSQLRAHALLVDAAVPMRSPRFGRAPWLVSAVAAALAFVAGMQFARRSTSVMREVVVGAVDTANATARIRRTAFEYISALASARVADTSAQTAAVSTFRVAADQIMRLAPSSDISLAISMALPATFMRSRVSVASSKATGSTKRTLRF